MIADDKRVRIMVGHYGSGKTEFSVNYAINLAKNRIGKKVAIADLDVINPYFRSREKEGLLKELGIESLSSVLRNSALDLPAVSAELSVPIIDNQYSYVMDVGGDELGARVLGSMHEIIKQSEYDMFMVINGNREYTSSPEKIIRYIREIEGASKLKVSGLVSNTHLLWETTKEDVIDGYNLVKQVSERINVPVRYVVYPNFVDVSEIKQQFEGKLFQIDMIMREQWM